MTKSKAIRLIAELIAKYGDVVVAKKYDYWASKTYVKEGEDINTIIAEIHLSEVEPPTGRSVFSELVDIVTGKSNIKYIPVEVEASKALYNTPEQAEYRRIAAKNARIRVKSMDRYLTYLIPEYLSSFYKM